MDVSSELSALAREIKQTKPFPSRSQEAGVALLRTADLVRRHVLGVLDPHGLSAQQYNVLRILRGAGEVGLPTLEIATRMVEHAPGITRLLDRLETKGLVRRERCKADRRQVLCFISEDGLALLGRLDAPILEADRRALGSLAPGEIEELLRLLDAVRAACLHECERASTRNTNPEPSTNTQPLPDRARRNSRRNT